MLFFNRPKKIVVADNKSLIFALKQLVTGKVIKAVESTKTALITLKRNKESIEVGIEFERQLEGKTVTESHYTVVYNDEEALAFFRYYGVVDQILWLPVS